MSQDLRIIFQDRNLIVVDKPAGLSVHNAEGSTNLLSLLDLQFPGGKLFPVHRLDKETSGVQILAMNENSARRIAEEFQSKTVIKKYFGICRGQMRETSGIWTRSLSDKAEGRRSPAGRAQDQVECETHFRVLRANRYFAFCEFDLKTGRQHQIRKHCALAGHHLIGDSRYGEPKYCQKIVTIYGTDRLFLHCHIIKIGDLFFESAAPSEFEKLV